MLSNISVSNELLCLDFLFSRLLQLAHSITVLEVVFGLLCVCSIPNIVC